MTRTLVATIAFAAMLIPAMPAYGVELVATTTAGSQFAPSTIIVPKGASLRLVQLDPTARHDLVSRQSKRGRALFGTSRTLGTGESAPVTGVESLSPASYPFTCSVHEFMSGRLIVQG